MSIYTQQASSLMERLPETEQVFVLEFIKKISTSYNAETPDAKQLNKKQREAVKNFIAGVNAAADEILDNEFAEIVENRINITRN